MILLSTTIYQTPSSLPTTPNQPLEHLTHHLERRLVLSLLCSLLNTSLTSPKANGVTGQIPYNHLISKGGEERRILVRASMMTLLVALDYKKVTPSSEVGMGEGKDDNAFRYFVSKLVSHPPLGPPLGGTTLVPFEHPSRGAKLMIASKRGLCIYPPRYPGDIGRTFPSRKWLSTRKQETDSIHSGNL
jgi:hypothetical protein